MILFFIDGVGLAPAGSDNPLSRLPTPTFRALLRGPLTLEALQQRQGLLLRAIDATLGVDGLPQSGTGQMAILGGFNAPTLHGRHQAHFPPVALRPKLAQENIFGAAQAVGARVAFANVFGPNYWQALSSRHIRPAASVIAAQGAGIKLRTLADLVNGRALCWDISATQLRMREPDIPKQTAEHAGHVLAALAREHEFVYFESFLPDLAAHGRLTSRWTSHSAGDTSQNDAYAEPGVMEQLADAFERIDRLLGSLLEAMRAEDTLVITSDHGNAESLSAPAHTRNPVPLLVIGPHAPRFVQVANIAEIAGVITEILGEGRGDVGEPQAVMAV